MYLENLSQVFCISRRFLPGITNRSYQTGANKHTFPNEFTAEETTVFLTDDVVSERAQKRTLQRGERELRTNCDKTQTYKNI